MQFQLNIENTKYKEKNNFKMEKYMDSTIEEYLEKERLLSVFTSSFAAITD